MWLRARKNYMVLGPDILDLYIRSAIETLQHWRQNIESVVIVPGEHNRHW